MSSLQQNWRRRQNRLCLEARGVEGQGGSGEKEGRNDPNNVFTYKYMNKKKWQHTCLASVRQSSNFSTRKKNKKTKKT
jgi:hypothetical protein